MSTLIDMNTKKLMLAKKNRELSMLFAEQEAGKKSRVKMYPIKAGTGLLVDGPEEDYRLRQGNPLVGMDYLNNNETPWDVVDYGIEGSNKVSNADGTGRQPFDMNNMGSNLMKLAPAFANLIGGKAEQLNPRDYYNPRRNQITSLMRNRRTNIQPQLDAILSSEKTGQYNLRNTANSRGEMMGNIIALNNNAARQRTAVYAGKQNMDLNYQGQEAEMLMGLGAGEQQANWNTMDWNQQSLANKRSLELVYHSYLSIVKLKNLWVIRKKETLN
jgi:hypothetical protein